MDKTAALSRAATKMLTAAPFRRAIKLKYIKNRLLNQLLFKNEPKFMSGLKAVGGAAKKYPGQALYTGALLSTPLLAYYSALDNDNIGESYE